MPDQIENQVDEHDPDRAPRFRAVSFHSFNSPHQIGRGQLPIIKHGNGVQPFRAEVISSGHCDSSGVCLEFQVIRLFFEIDPESEKPASCSRCGHCGQALQVGP